MNIVRQLREKRGIQQKEFAMRIGVSQPTVSEWEHGKKDPSGDRLVKECHRILFYARNNIKPR